MKHKRKKKPSQQREQRETHVDATTVEANLISHKTIETFFFASSTAWNGKTKENRKKRQKSIREREREPAKEMYLGGFARKKLKSQENLFEALVLASLPALGLLELSLSPRTIWLV